MPCPFPVEITAGIGTLLVEIVPKHHPVGFSGNLLHEYYLREHERGAQKKFAADNTRSINHVIRLCGNLPLMDYRRHHAEKVRDDLLVVGKSRSARKHLSAIAAVFTKAIEGFDLNMERHPFVNVKIKQEGEDGVSKRSFTEAELQVAATAAHLANDSLRQIVAMLINTGARVSEIVGLKVGDLILDGDIPHMLIRPHDGLLRDAIAKVSIEA
jgi:integrase